MVQTKIMPIEIHLTIVHTNIGEKGNGKKHICHLKGLQRRLALTEHAALQRPELKHQDLKEADK